MKVVLYETPNLRVYSTGGLIASIVVGAVIIGVIGAGLGYAVHHAVSTQAKDPELPDFGKIVTDRFVERSKNEIVGWPPMNVADAATTEAAIDKSSNIIEIKVDDIRVEKGSALITQTILTMKNREGATVWQKGYAYDSTFFNRPTTLEKLKADNYKLFKEEFTFAAEQTVTDFINHFNNAQVALKKQ